MQKYFKRTSPEAEGLDSMKIKLFLQELDRCGFNLRTLLIIRHGHVVAEAAKYPFLPEDKRLVYSCSKSFTGTAVGIAEKEGLLDINDFILDYFPEYAGIELDDRVKRIKIRDLLTMSTGHGCDSVGDICNGEDDWVRTFLTRTMDFEPGEKFVYDSGGTYMLSEIISRVTHQPMFEYLKKELFGQLHIEDVMWEYHGNVNTGAWGVLIAPEDLAKLGMLYLHKGIFEEQRILPEKWVQDASAHQIDTGFSNPAGWSQGYGYQIWKNNETSFRMDGAFGQYCMVFPKEDMIVVTTAEECNAARMFPLIEKYLLKELSDQPYSDAITYGELKKYIMKWETPLIYEPTESYMEQLLNQRMFEIQDEHQVKHQITFEIDNSKLELNIDQIQVIKSSAVSCLSGETSYVIMPPSVSPIIGSEQMSRKWCYSAHHEWINDGTLQLTVWYRETGHIQKWLFVFVEDTVEIIISNSIKRFFGLFPIKSDRNVDFGDMILRGRKINK